MTGCTANATPLCAAAEGWVFMDRSGVVPSVAVATNVTGEPCSPMTVAVVVCCPAELPRIRWMDALPSVPVPEVGADTLPAP
jgi:hypothetical protein